MTADVRLLAVGPTRPFPGKVEASRLEMKGKAMLSVEKVRRIEKLRKADALTLARARESYEASYVALLVRCLEAGAFLPCETHDRARAIFAAVRGTEVDAKGHLDP